LLKRVELRQIAVDVTAWYWHVMGLAWLLLLVVLTAGQ
jgi:cytochrome c oxidase subunit 3